MNHIWIPHCDAMLQKAYYIARHKFIHIYQLKQLKAHGTRVQHIPDAAMSEVYCRITD